MEAKTQIPIENQATNSDINSQSVFIANPGIVKTYSKIMSDNEINYDVQTNVKGKTPEDFYINFQPFQELKNSFKELFSGGFYTPMTKPAQVDLTKSTPISNLVQETGKKIGEGLDLVKQGVKFAVADPEAALLGKPTSPQALVDTYKPWIDLWRESKYGKPVAGTVEQYAAKHPVAGFVPWFLTEFIPGELLEFGTNPVSWVGAYGIQKLGPPILNEVVQSLPEPFRKILLTDLWKSEEGLTKSFETLGVNPNVKTSEITKAFRGKALETHPDRIGGSHEAYVKVQQAYDDIMSTRSTMLNKLVDKLRSPTVPETGSVAPGKELMGLVGKSGQAVMPFNEGDLVKIGKDTGQFIKQLGNMAVVNLAGKETQVALNKIKPYPAKTAVSPGEPASEEGKPAVNLENINSTEEAKQRLQQATKVISDELQNQTGKSVTHEEVIEKAKEAEILNKGVSREATLNFEAALLKTRQHLAALAEQKELTPEFLDTLRIVANTGTDIARQLESFKIEAMPEYATQKTKIIRDILKLGKSAEEILSAAKGVDFTDQEQVANFYRKFVKAGIFDEINEFAYVNILSSPKTHIVNTFSNILQLAGLNPLHKLASGGYDAIASALTGAERTHYINEIPSFYKGAINAIPMAIEKSVAVMQGKQQVERPDIKNIPTKAKWIDKATLGLGKYIPRALEASDVFFRTMIGEGEKEALANRYGGNIGDKEQLTIDKEAQRRAEYYVFRQKPDVENASGQGDLLTAIDKMTSAVYRLRQVPGARWFIRFVQTPMNILKQGIENSPAGFATMKGAKDKSEQAGKAIIGSMVFVLGSYLALSKRMTWSVPTSKTDRADFYAAGMQPYSIKIGDTWLSYSKLGPLAYPLAMASALNYYEKESPNALSDTAMEKGTKALAGIMEFFSDQSYVQGLGDLVKTLKGDTQSITRVVTSLPTQVIPLSSLQGWVNQLIDPLYRKPGTGISIQAIVDNLKQKIVGLSFTLPTQKDILEQPSKKSMKELNAVSPVGVRKSNPQFEQIYEAKQKGKREKKRMEKIVENAEKSYLNK